MTNVRVTWSPPSSDGGSPITSYQVAMGPRSTTAVSSPATLTNVPDGTWRASVTATNAVGTSSPAYSGYVTINTAPPSGNVQSVAWWEGYWNWSGVNTWTSTAEADLLVVKSDGGSHAMYRSAYTFFDGCVAMWRATDDTQYLNHALDWVEYCINQSTPAGSGGGQGGLAFNDSYRSWWGNVAGQEHSLREAYLWRYVTIMLREMNAHPTLLGTSNYQTRYDAILEFTEVHIWEKWRNRTGFSGTVGPSWWQLYRNRTHMASHWAHIGMNLHIIATRQTVRDEGIAFVHEFNNGMYTCPNSYEAYGDSMRGQLTYDHPNSPNGVVWCNEWGKTWASAGYSTDGDHAAAEVGAICEMFDFGHDYTQAEINAFIALMNEYYFTTTLAAAHQYPPSWVAGSSGPYTAGTADLFTDGFIKLGRFDEAIQLNLETYQAAGGTGFSQLQGNGALNAAILTATKPW